MKIRGRARAHAARRGTVLALAAIVSLTLAGLAIGMLTFNLEVVDVRVSDMARQRLFYTAEAGLNDAYVQAQAGAFELAPGETVALGSEQAPIAFGKAAYWVDIASVGPRSYSIASTAMHDGAQERLELVLSTSATGFFQYAAFGANGIVLDSNAFIDSYDSAYGSYASQVKGGNAFARENGNVGSNDDIVLRSNTEVHGDCTPGPGHTVDDSAPRTFVSGSTEPAEEEVEMPPIVVPAIATSGTLAGPTAFTVGPGAVHYDSIQVDGGGSLTVVGPATLVVDDLLMKSNTELRFDTTGGPVELVGTADFVLESNSKVVTSGESALDVTLLLAGDNMTKRPGDDVELGANADFVGAIYAPNVDFRLASNFNIYGSIMCGYLDLSSFGEIHFDEALLYEGYGATGEYEAAYWGALPHQ